MNFNNDGCDPLKKQYDRTDNQIRRLVPIGKKTTNFSVNEMQKASDFSLPYREEKGELKENLFVNVEPIGPAGSINSSVNEMAIWMLLQLNKGKVGDKRIISEKSLSKPRRRKLSFASILKTTKGCSTAMRWVGLSRPFADVRNFIMEAALITASLRSSNCSQKPVFSAYPHANHKIR